jgi:hypothetical protein
VRPYLEKNHKKGGEAQGVDPEFKPQYCKKKKKQLRYRRVLKSVHPEQSQFALNVLSLELSICKYKASVVLDRNPNHATILS